MLVLVLASVPDVKLFSHCSVLRMTGHKREVRGECTMAAVS
jgi:hypothetical protein